MLRFATSFLLFISCTVSALPTTMNYSWVVAYVSDPSASALMGKTISGEFTFQEVAAATADGVRSYKIANHTVTVDGQVLTGVGSENTGGRDKHSIMVNNNKYGITSGDSIVITSTISGSTYSTLDVQGSSLFFIDPDGDSISTYGLTAAAINSAFELSDGRLFVRASGSTDDILVSSQGFLTALDSGSAGSDTVYPIVYSRVARLAGDYTATINSVETTSDKWSFYQNLPETGRIKTNFAAPGQLVYRDTDGTQTVIYDCMTATKPCVPFDQQVSLDGTKIAFAVYEADAVVHTYPANREYPPMVLGSVGGEAFIMIYDIATETLTAWPHTAGDYDFSPVWLPNGKMMFNSDRDGYYQAAYGILNIGVTKDRSRLYIADDDGTNVEDVSPDQMNGAIGPYLLDTGRIVASAQWVSHNQVFTKSTQINWPDTPENFWPIIDMDLRGGDVTAVLGAHHMRLVGSDESSNTVKALHYIGQRGNGDVCTVNYYRSNNNGLGDVICYPPQAPGIEGPAPNFTPTGLYDVGTWTNSNDQGSEQIDGVHTGKLGWPEGVSDNQLMLTFGRGYCTSVNSSALASELLYLETKNDPGCDTGIYKTTVIPSTNPSDLELIVDDSAWHEFNAREVKARTITVPDLTAKSTGDSTCQLYGVDADETDAHYYSTYDFNNMLGRNMNNGNELYGIDHSEVAAIRFYEVLPNLTNPLGVVLSSIGNNTKLFGDVPLETDGSWRVQIPCNTPYLMGGVDSDGLLIKRDMTAQSLRTGEKRTCTGCHLHGGDPVTVAATPPMSESTTLQVFTSSTALPTYTTDILPILQNRCAGCHDGVTETDVHQVPLYVYEDLVWDYLQASVPDSMKFVTRAAYPGTNWEFHLQRPQTSKYVDSRYARKSLLYWKVMGARTDGMLDSDWADDLDYGTAHTSAGTTTTEEETIAAWLDSGAPK